MSKYQHETFIAQLIGHHSADDIHVESDDAFLERILPFSFMLDLKPDDRLTFRLVGNAIRTMLGFDPEHSNFYDYWNTEAEIPLRYFFRSSAENAKAFCVYSTSANRELDFIELETVVVPVSEPAFGQLASFMCVMLAGDGSRLDFGGPEARHQHLHDIHFLRPTLPNERNGNRNAGEAIVVQH